MEPNLSQRTLGMLREILEGMQSEDVITPYENRKFWKDALFDFGFSKTIIDTASKYNFSWSDIIPDLYVGNFGDHNSYFSDVIPAYFCEQALKKLLAFALYCNRDTPQAEELLRSLESDGFDLKAGSQADSSVPAELAQIPSKIRLISDVQQKVDACESVSVLYMDLDGFKAVNDTMGHAEGDECLIRIARTMGAAILGKGKLYRPGGDEFVVVLPNFKREEAASTAERIRAAIDDENPGGTLKVTVSIGVANSELPSATTAEALIMLADKAMYEAKKTKNRVAVATD
jgi:diguanylate cyclase (GGDEF)-like protein